MNKLEDAIVVLDCGEYFVATLNISTHIKKSKNKNDLKDQKEKIKNELKEKIISVANK